MRGRIAFVFAALLALCIPARSAVTVKVDMDSITVGRDSNIVKMIKILRGDSARVDVQNPLAAVPAEAWAKLTPEQTQDLIETSLALQRPPHDETIPSSDSRVEIIVPVAFFAACVLALFFLMRWRMHQSKLVHEQRLAMIAQGIVPPDMTTQPKPAAPRVQKMVIWGWIMALGGVGLSIAKVLEEGWSQIGWGLVIMLVGVGLLMAARYIGGQPVTGPKEGETPPSQDGTTA
ncbi:MAG: hypothetical protein BWY06_02653 [Candidatus Latescibacteria bacterium ADurb.Bin168]|nr:MAG: hypothetical protein BWY06_02653 [Candidatus Latescibacteria bacterium ADurb.Bin168]